MAETVLGGVVRQLLRLGLLAGALSACNPARDETRDRDSARGGAPGAASARQTKAAAEPHDAASAAASGEPAAHLGVVARRARVVVTGVLLHQASGFELCPGRRTTDCPGIELHGPFDPALVSTTTRSVVVRVPGTYDGSTLHVDGPLEVTDLGRERDYRNPCPEFQNELPPDKDWGPNPNLVHSEATERFVKAHADRFAAQWWDRERRTMVVGLTGDVTTLKDELRSTAGKQRVCLFGGARFSERELEAARERVDAMVVERGLVRSGSSLDSLLNRVVYGVEAIDQPTLRALRPLAGEAVRLLSFIELVDLPLTLLPEVRLPGEIRLETGKARIALQMLALGHFSVHFDPERECVYLKNRAGKRLLPVWPFGYSARKSPLEILDFDGNVVAKEGVMLPFGGGHRDLTPEREGKSCGAEHVWVGSPARR